MDHNPERTDAHPLSEKQTNTDDTKLTTAIAAVTDPEFPLPTLTSKSTAFDYVRSFGMLSVLLGVGIFGAWVLDLEILRAETVHPAYLLGALFMVVVGAMFFTGTVWIDWYELVLGYWWLSIPIGMLAGLGLVLNQEASATMSETD